MSWLLKEWGVNTNAEKLSSFKNLSITDIEPSYILTSISLSLKFEYIDLK